MVVYLQGQATADGRGQYSRGRDVYRAAVRVVDIGAALAVIAGVILGALAAAL